MASPEIEAKLEEQRALAPKLGVYVGQWVAVKGPSVVASDADYDGLVRRVASADVDRVFQVPDCDTWIL